MRCENQLCPRRDEPLGDGTRRNEEHGFSGYAFYIAFHPECCAGSVDGTDCDHEHPPGWRPPEESYDRVPPCAPFDVPPLSGPPRVDRIPTDAGGVAEVPSDRPLTQAAIDALKLWPGRVQVDSGTVRGYARGGFLSRLRIQWVRVVAHTVWTLPEWFVAVLRDDGWPEIQERDRVWACPHPDSRAWRWEARPGMWLCTCGAEVPAPKDAHG